MDRPTRNRIQRATQDARRILEQEYSELLEGTYDILPDGRVPPEPGEHLTDQQRITRQKLVAAVAHRRAGGERAAEAVAGYVREAAFTTLNRFVALKMLEARDLVQQCVSRGSQSTGFKEFCGLAPGLAALLDHGYRLYIESLFDEIGREVRVLFDRQDPASLLWPRRQALARLLEILNAEDLAEVWGEDETIGWVYQYFNSDDDVRRARYDEKGKPKAPQNSYELAVRNQFFTPRYVVKFLTDNTLGRIWYEMRGGDTRLRALDYLVLRSNEIFLAEEEEAPAEPDGEEQEVRPEAPGEPFYVLFRPKKDVRDLRVLDPACGSGHFLLYAFDLLLAIYEEAWQDDNSPPSEVTGRTLRADYETEAALREDLPRLILRHNLHGIDVDPRCAQIAALALWMRAQRAYADFGIDRTHRPDVRKTNVVVGEPMPGEADLRREFVASLDERLGRLVEHVFERMELAGEAGSLLRIEEDIQRAVQEQGVLFRDDKQDRWRAAEEELLAALRSYAEQAENGRAYERRLFAEDAARGLGFVDLCRQRYDVVLMNPPFGAFAEKTREWARRSWPRTKNDIFAAFVERGVGLAVARGRVGAITSRTGFFLSSFQKWREEVLLQEAPPVVVADLGHGVMDDAMVEAAAYCLERVA